MGTTVCKTERQTTASIHLEMTTVRKFCVHGRPRVKLLKTCCSAMIALSLAAPVAAYAPDPVVITLDGRDYIGVVPVVIAPVERLVLAPDSSLSNCHRKD